MNQPVETKAVSVLEPALKDISTSRAAQIEAVFVPMVAKLKEFEADHAAILLDADKKITEDVIQRSMKLRIAIGKVRIETEKMRKSEKEEYLRAGKAIDGVANILKFAVSGKEQQLRDIENHFKDLEIKRLEELGASRSAMVEMFGIDMEPDGLANMSDEVWDNFHNGAKTGWEHKQAAIKKAEQDAMEAAEAKAIEDERIRKENEELKEAAELKAKQEELDAARRHKDEQDRIEKEKAAKHEREIVEGKRVAAQKKAAADAEAKAQRDKALADAELEKQKKAADDKLKKEREAEQVKRDAERKEFERKQAVINQTLEKERAETKRKEDQRIADEKAEADRVAALAKAADDVKLAAFKDEVLLLWKNVPKLKNKSLEDDIKDAIATVGELCK